MNNNSLSQIGGSSRLSSLNVFNTKEDNRKQNFVKQIKISKFYKKMGKINKLLRKNENYNRQYVNKINNSNKKYETIKNKKISENKKLVLLNKYFNNISTYSSLSDWPDDDDSNELKKMNVNKVYSNVSEIGTMTASEEKMLKKIVNKIEKVDPKLSSVIFNKQKEYTTLLRKPLKIICAYALGAGAFLILAYFTLPAAGAATDCGNIT